MGYRSSKIRLFKWLRTKSEIQFGFGDYALDDICVSCTVEENLETSEYFLDAEFLVDDSGLYLDIREECVLKVDLDYGYEIFSIVDVKRTPSRVIVFARQITINESIGMWLDDVRPENKNGIDALNHMQDNSVGPKNIEFYSNIDTIGTAYYINKTLYNALHVEENCFQKVWGGEIQRRGYTLTIHERIGKDTNIVIRTGKNLTGFEASTNIDSIVTRIKPIGFNGITTDGFVDSPLINDYKYVRTQTMEYPHVKLASDIEEGSEPEEGDLVFNTLAEAQAKLTELALLEYLSFIDVLRAEYTISFVDLSNTEEYKNFAATERVQLGDEVVVYEDTHGIEVKVRAISRKFNVLTQRIDEMKLSNNIAESSVTVEEVASRLDAVTDDVNYMSITYAKVADIEAKFDDLEDAVIEKADIEDLETTNANVNKIASNVSNIQHLVNGNLTSNNIQSLSADKINSGTINTNSITIKSNDDSLRLSGNLMQFKDKDENTRFQIGKEDNGDFRFILYDESGQEELINQNGITASAICDGLIVNNMVAENAAINGSKLDINSVITSINDNGTESLKSSRICLDEQNQTLQEAFNQLQDKAETNTSNIEDIQELIETLQKTIEDLKTRVEELEGNNDNI